MFGMSDAVLTLQYYAEEGVLAVSKPYERSGGVRVLVGPSNCAARSLVVPKIACATRRRKNRRDELQHRRQRELNRILKPRGGPRKDSKGKRRTNVVEGDVSHAEDELFALVMDVTGIYFGRYRKRKCSIFLVLTIPFQRRI